MFTGIVETTGRIEAVEPKGGDVRLRVAVASLAGGPLAPGESVSVDGVCLTAVDPAGGAFDADVSRETLEHTTIGDRRAGDAVNLERALLPDTRLGGHFVSGHVDGVGEIIEQHPDARSTRFVLRLPEALSRFVARKGSVCLDGVSLTVNSVGADRFDVNIVPHTLEVTCLDRWHPGRRVNVEVDLIARYLERLLDGREAGGLDRESLRRAGFEK